jgi:EAL domain-containing protein (putative c-di-GMP-specific phosphodiesterase class I)
MNVTAEDLETDEQRIELKSLGCDGGQGFVFARPVDADQMKQVLAISKTGALVTA